MSELHLTGLDGKNPLGFLAALGALNALEERWERGRARLVWREAGTFVPAIVDGPEREALLDVLLDDLRSFEDEPAIERLRYKKEKKKGDEEKKKEAIAHDLKPPPAFFLQYLEGLVLSGTPRSLGYAAAFATDVAVDENGNTKPTALHFTAGQQEFLAMVEELRQGKGRVPGVGRGDLEEALFGPWRYGRLLPVLQWDNTSARDYALRATNPSTDKKTGVPGADWLAFRGLPFIRVAPIRDRIETTGCSGGWKTGAFRWPLWTVPLGRNVIRSLLSSPELSLVQPEVMQARGIGIVFEAGIRRSDQGGYGSFSPARVAESQTTK